MITFQNTTNTLVFQLSIREIRTPLFVTQKNKLGTGIYKSEKLRIRETQKVSLKLTLIAEFAPVSWIALALTGHTFAVTVTPVHAAFCRNATNYKPYL
jgi:hypothetical protein